MKAYQAIDNADAVLVTADELTALRKLRQIMLEHDVTWGWINELEVR